MKELKGTSFDHVFGACTWSGTFKNMPAIVGSYHGGASLYIYKNNKWYVYAKGKNDTEVIPTKKHTPIENVFLDEEEKNKQMISKINEVKIELNTSARVHNCYEGTSMGDFCTILHKILDIMGESIK